jgi:hypothetical protein
MISATGPSQLALDLFAGDERGLEFQILRGKLDLVASLS